MARTAPAPDMAPVPGMCPSIAVLAGGGDEVEAAAWAVSQADGGGEREGVVRLLQVAAAGPALGERRDGGQHLGLLPVGADLLPHGDGQRGDQLLLGLVGGAIAGAQALDGEDGFGHGCRAFQCSVPR